MTQPTALLLKTNLKQLKLPTVLAEHEKLAREAAANNEPYEGYLLRLTELEVATRSANALTGRIRAAAFPVTKDFDTYDFTTLPGLPKQKVLELARGEWIEQHYNCCLIGNAGTGKTHLATALGLAACRQGRRVRFFTAAGLVNQLEEAHQQHRLDRLLAHLDRTDLLICDELGYLSFSRSGAELLFQVFAERYERRSLLVTSNLAFGEWGQVFQGERMTAALLDRLTHRCHIFEMNGESYRFRESMKAKKEPPKKGK
jgi:DNA replication protein DnaC